MTEFVQLHSAVQCLLLAFFAGMGIAALIALIATRFDDRD